MILTEEEQQSYEYLFGPKLEFDSTAANVANGASHQPQTPQPIKKQGIWSKMKTAGKNIYNGAKQGMQLAGSTMGAVNGNAGAAAGMIHGAITSTKKGRELIDKIEDKVF